MRMVQFMHDKRVLSVPLEVFCEISEQLGKPRSKMIFLSNTGRCGSTMLSQVFEASHCVSLCEPDFGQNYKMYTQLPLQTKSKKRRGVCHQNIIYCHLFAAFMWGCNIKQYLDFIANEMDIYGVRYEDVMNNTETALQQIYDHYGLQFNYNHVCHVFNNDSQHGSPLSMKRLKHYNSS